VTDRFDHEYKQFAIKLEVIKTYIYITGSMALKLIMASAVQAIASSLYSSTYLSINLYTVCLVAKLNNRKLMSGAPKPT